MKKLLYPLVGIACIVGLWYLFQYKSCEEPSDIKVAMSALECAQETLDKPVEEVRAELCSYIEKGPECEFSEEDKFTVIEVLNSKIFTCTKKKLKAENLCVDKVDAIMKSKGL